jgi:hypothetical protein
MFYAKGGAGTFMAAAFAVGNSVRRSSEVKAAVAGLSVESSYFRLEYQDSSSDEEKASNKVKRMKTRGDIQHSTDDRSTTLKHRRTYKEFPGSVHSCRKISPRSLRCQQPRILVKFQLHHPRILVKFQLVQHIHQSTSGSIVFNIYNR